MGKKPREKTRYKPMNWTDVVVALIALVGTCVGTIYGIRKSSSLVEYRLKELEKKVDLHNNLVERMTVAEHDIKALKNSNEKQNAQIISQSEQIDQAYTLAEKNEGRIQLLEKGFMAR